MQPWTQIYDPLGNLWLSSLIAALPIIFFFIALAVLRMKGHVAGTITKCAGRLGVQPEVESANGVAVLRC